jgi:hypothetical protein
MCGGQSPNFKNWGHFGVQLNSGYFFELEIQEILVFSS